MWALETILVSGETVKFLTTETSLQNLQFLGWDFLVYPARLGFSEYMFGDRNEEKCLKGQSVSIM